MKKSSILIVEDEAIVSLDLSILLQNAGYEINRICSSSNELFKGFESDSLPDLILMDINIKGDMDGLESSLKIKELYSIPVIFLTAYADRDTLEKAKNSYPYGYIIKPYDKMRLLVIIEMALNIINLEKEIRFRETLFQSTFDNINDGIVICDEKDCIKYINPAARIMTETDNFSNRPFLEVFPINFSVGNKKVVVKDREGQERTLEIKKNKWKESAHRFSGSVWILRDVTLQLYLETQLRESHKMEAVGRLAGGVAHDFNNLLTVIMGYCSLILDNKDIMDVNPSLESDVKGIQITSQKAVKLTRQLLTFSDTQIHNPRNIDLNSIILDQNRIFERIIPDSIELKINLTEQQAVINIDPVQMEQILVNLVVNSRDAISDKGYIDIETDIINFSNRHFLKSGEIPAGDYVKMSVRDNGMGIPAEIQSMIFEPFFSTKAGQGSGLGLSTVYGIIQNSGGYIDLISETDPGTEFILYFPRYESEDIQLKNNRKSVIRDMGNEFILVVEEDDFVRSIMERILRNKKYNVTVTGFAGEALLLCEKRELPFDLLITDLFMPLISGEELSLRISQMFPSIKTLYTSTAISGSLNVNNFIQKPFDPDDFSVLVRKCLDGN